MGHQVVELGFDFFDDATNHRNVRHTGHSEADCQDNTRCPIRGVIRRPVETQMRNITMIEKGTGAPSVSTLGARSPQAGQRVLSWRLTCSTKPWSRALRERSSERVEALTTNLLCWFRRICRFHDRCRCCNPFSYVAGRYSL